MAAILGRVAFDGRPLDERVFRRAFDRLRPARCVRSDMAVAGAAGFGHHDAGLDGPAAPQPLREGPLTIVADARLYNRDDLARALGLPARGLPAGGVPAPDLPAPDLPARGQGDAALILQAYARWGAGCLAHLNGDFGFAVHDARSGELFLARDHIGARPLFWTLRGNEALFATLLPGLAGFDDLPWPLSERRIARYLCDPQRHLPPESFLDGVEAVGAGHWVRLRAGQVTRGCWWDPAALPHGAATTQADAEEGLRTLTAQAVRARLPAAAPVGAHFSGGIDSTLVTTLAAEALRARGATLTRAYAWSPPVARYPDMGPGDERRVIAAHCDALGVPAAYGAATGATFEALVAQPMELQGSADLVDELPVIARARDDGLGVMLSGWGGDEVFSSHGNGHLAWMLRRGRLGGVLGTARYMGGGLRRPHRMAGFLWTHGIVPMLPGPLYRHFQPFADLYGGGAFASARMTALHRAAPAMEELRLLPDADAYMRALLGLGHIAERMATWAAWSAPAGFEYRYPLTDRALLEFLLGLPREIRFGDGSGRVLVRRAFRERLPKGVNKNDVANEKLREDSRMAWWAMLAADARQGRFDTPCPWLDMPALKAATLQQPPGDKHAQISVFARFLVALRVLGMHARQQQSPAGAAP